MSVSRYCKANAAERRRGRRRAAPSARAEVQETRPTGSSWSASTSCCASFLLVVLRPADLHRRQLVQQPGGGVVGPGAALAGRLHAPRLRQTALSNPQIITGFLNSLFYTVVGTLDQRHADRRDRLPAVAQGRSSAGT